MSRRLLPSKSVGIVGVLFIATGITMLIALAFAPTSIGSDPPTSLVGVFVASAFAIGILAVVVLVSGVGLLRNQLWGWLLGVLIALSGIVIVALRLIGNDGSEGQLLLPALVTDMLVLILLFAGRPRAVPAISFET